MTDRSEIMEFNRKNMARIFLLSACIILFYLSFKHMDLVFSFIGWLIGVFTPFIIAGVVIFILNVPLKAIERHLFRPKDGRPVSKLKDKLRRPIAIVLSISLFIAIIGVFLVIIIPEIAKSLQAIAEKIPDTISRSQEWVAEMSKREDFLGQVASQVNIDWDTLNNTLVNFLQDNSTSLVSSAWTVITTLINAAVNMFLGIVLAVYILANKEKISSDVKKLIYSAIPTKKADFICEIGRLTNKSFYNSITGQMIECLIIGSLTSLGMALFNFPYAALGGVVVAVMSWIPMFGIFIGSAVVALLLLATADPIQALWFIIYMVILQQIEGNLIFPRVVGSRIGLPPIIMISAIILFSAFFGLIGLLVSGPVTFVIYTFVRRFVYHRIETKKIPHHKYDPCYDSPERDIELEKELEKEIASYSEADSEAENGSDNAPDTDPEASDETNISDATEDESAGEADNSESQTEKTSSAVNATSSVETAQTTGNKPRSFSKKSKKR